MNRRRFTSLLVALPLIGFLWRPKHNRWMSGEFHCDVCDRFIGRITMSSYYAVSGRAPTAFILCADHNQPDNKAVASGFHFTWTPQVDAQGLIQG